jgi:uncharacterized protein YjiS (DUF1127 family)
MAVPALPPGATNKTTGEMVMLQLVLTQALTRAEQSRPGFRARIADRAHTQWQGYKARRRYRKTVRTLNGLDDRTLHDIGVHRSEIESYAWAGGTGRYPERFATNEAFPRG